jgi:PAS domain S-box-containing protein
MKAIENFGKVVSTGESLHFENYSQDLQKWFEVYSYRSGPGQFAFVLLDISERKKAEEALVESEARFRSVLDSTRDVIYRTNLRTGRYEYISPSSEEIIGYSGSELAALNRQTSLAMIHPDDLSLFQSLLKHSEETGYGEGEYLCRPKRETTCGFLIACQLPKIALADHYTGMASFVILPNARRQRKPLKQARRSTIIYSKR